jgi:hypothetical protein
MDSVLNYDRYVVSNSFAIVTSQNQMVQKIIELSIVSVMSDQFIKVQHQERVSCYWSRPIIKDINTLKHPTWSLV